MNIGVDLDCVVADFIQPLLNYYFARTGRRFVHSDINSFHLEEVWGVTPEEAVAVVREFYQTPEFGNLPPLYRAVESIHELAEDNFIHFVTSRHNEARTSTPKWLNRHFASIPYGLHYTGNYENGDIVSKATLCNGLHIDVILEDGLHYAQECLENRLPVILFDWRWNQGFVHPRMTRVGNYLEEPNRAWEGCMALFRR